MYYGTKKLRTPKDLKKHYKQQIILHFELKFVF